MMQYKSGPSTSSSAIFNMADMADDPASAPAPAKLQRIRKAKYSLAEEEVLQQEVAKNLSLLREKHGTEVTNKQKQKVWKEITDKINSL